MNFSELGQIFIDNWIIIILFFLIAVFYSSVGFGGGSSYLAVLALTGLAFTQIRTIALLCNIVVVSGGTYVYIKKDFFNYRKILPLVLLSIPLAFFGGYLQINVKTFYILLGLTLTVAAVTMGFSKYIDKTENLKESTLVKDASFGGIIGFISGMVGIGGGVFLAPLLHLTKWDTPKRIAATSSFFILVNSIAGLIGQYQNPDFELAPKLTLILVATVLLGGQIGSRLSAQFISPVLLKRLTAILIVFVGIKILTKYLF
ncbi:MAG: sulfite exporter TauE/SafE family protein [Flavobacteriaceae bacterium]|nr:sulfite exporter TauE/SafE family protein [Flavobacteriaceae bacterium]